MAFGSEVNNDDISQFHTGNLRHGVPENHQFSSMIDDDIMIIRDQTSI